MCVGITWEIVSCVGPRLVRGVLASDQDNPAQPQRGSGRCGGRAGLDPGRLVVPGLVRAVRGGGLGGLLVWGDGDGQAEGLQAAQVVADLLVPVDAAGVEVRAEVAVAGLGVI